MLCNHGQPALNALSPCSPPRSAQGWGENDRGVSYTFGPDSVTEFLQRHDLDLICRAHQVVEGERRGSGEAYRAWWGEQLQGGLASWTRPGGIRGWQKVL